MLLLQDTAQNRCCSNSYTTPRAAEQSLQDVQSNRCQQKSTRHARGGNRTPDLRAHRQHHKRAHLECKSSSLCLPLLGHKLGKVHNTLAVAPLVVVPGHNLHHVVTHHHGQAGVDGGGHVSAPAEVGGEREWRGKEVSQFEVQDTISASSVGEECQQAPTTQPARCRKFGVRDVRQQPTTAAALWQASTTHRLQPRYQQTHHTILLFLRT